MKVIDFITLCYCDLDACRVRLPPFSASEVSLFQLLIFFGNRRSETPPTEIGGGDCRQAGI